MDNPLLTAEKLPETFAPHSGTYIAFTLDAKATVAPFGERAVRKSARIVTRKYVAYVERVSSGAMPVFP